MYYIFNRVKPEQSICRMGMLYLTAGEIWYLRLILLNKPVYSYTDARTVDNILYRTFQEAAIVLGYCTGTQPYHA